MSNFMAELFSEKNKPILDYLIIKPYLAELHPLKLFYSGKKSIFPIITEKSKEKKFSHTDLEILKLLSGDGRAKIIDIAKKTGISAEMVLHKLKKFQNERVILGCRAGIRMKKLGYNYSMIFLNIKNLSHEIKENIINFARSEKAVNSLILSLFNPNCIIQVFYETEDELKNIIKKIKELLKNEIFDLDILLAQEEDKVNTLPFIR